MTPPASALARLLAVPALLVAGACSSASEEAPEDDGPDTTQAPPGSWVLGVYMAADNNLDPVASVDLNEMLSAQIPEGVEVLVFIDRTAAGTYERAAVPGLPDDGGARLLRVGEDSVEVLEEYGEVDSLSVERLHAFIERLSQANAETRALVFWDHGAAGAYGSDHDGGAGAATIEALRRAFQRDLADATAGYHQVDVLGFDTCQLGSLGALEQLGPLTSVFIGSAENEPGDGWDYTATINAMFDDELSPERFATAVVDAYRAYYVEDFPARAGGLKVTLAAFRTDLTALNQAFADLNEAFAEVQTAGQGDSVYLATARAIAKSSAYGTAPGAPPRNIDAGGFFGRLADADLDQLSALAQTVTDQALAQRIAFAAHPDRAGELGISMPSPAVPEAATTSAVGRFVVDAAGEDSDGRAELAAGDAEPPSVTLVVTGESGSPEVPFALCEFAASDDVLIDEASVSLARSLGGSEALLYATFRVPQAVAETTFGPETFGVPVGTFALSDVAAPDDDELAWLVGDGSDLGLVVRVRNGGVDHDGLIVLDDALAPAALRLTSLEDGVVSYVLWEDALAYPDAELAPALGVFDTSTEVLTLQLGTFRPLGEMQVVFDVLGAASDLELVGTASDAAGNVTEAVAALP